MQIVLLRVGIDMGCGGMHGPLFQNGSFEFIPIPDESGTAERTYGNTLGRHGRNFVDYFPERRRHSMADQCIHHDPEFETFTYGDPTALKRRLRTLEQGNLLVFYAGLQALGLESPAALYIVGYFEVWRADLATAFSHTELDQHFRNNFHVMHRDVFEREKDRLVLVKGGDGSRLLRKPVRISVTGTDRSGGTLKCLSPEMQRVFGHFDGHTSIQRCSPRWVAPEFIEGAAEFVRSLA